jgi:serine/threonine protein kinase
VSTALFDNANDRVFFVDKEDKDGSIIYVFNVPFPKSYSLIYFIVIASSILAGMVVLGVVTTLVFIFRKTNIFRNHIRYGSQGMGARLLSDNDEDSIRCIESYDGIIPVQELQLHTIIKEDTDGTLYRGTYEEHDVTIKKIRISFSNIAERSEFMKQVRTLMGVQHLHVQKLYGICIEDYYRYIVTEYSQSSLDSLLVGNQLTFCDKLKFLCQICQAMIHLHSMEPPIIHGNLSPNNILLDSQMQVRLR